MQLKGLLLGLSLTLLLTGCVFSAAGPAYPKSTGRGEERLLIGVVNGIWRYDQSQNLGRLERFLPGEDETELVAKSLRYQVRVGFDRGLLYGKSVEVAILPEGWKHTTKPDAQDEQTVQPGDILVVSAQKGRLVDYVKSIKRRCDEPAEEGEKKELLIGCFVIEEFGRGGYGGKKYFFTAF